MNVADRKFLLYRELEAVSRKQWLVQNLLGSGDASAFYGIPGCGKSVLVEDMALHVAAGQELARARGQARRCPFRRA